MVFFSKPGDNLGVILKRVSDLLAKSGLEVKPEKTRVVASTDGFDFLGWHFLVKPNGKFICMPSKDNYQAFRSKVKAIVNNSNYGAKVKAQKLAPVVRGWRKYHKFCDMYKYHLWGMEYDAFLKFNREKKQDQYSSKELVKKAFPTVKWKAAGFIKVKADRSPYDGDTLYWSKRNSALYDNHTAKALKRQDHTCGHCGHHFVDGEEVELHHIDGNHNNWKPKNLTAIHRSCHHYVHMSNR